MQHLINLAELLKKELGIKTIIEPLRASTPKEIRIAPQKIELNPGDFFEKSRSDTSAIIAQSYEIKIPVVISLRILGGNENFSLTREAVLFSIRMQQFFSYNQIIELDFVEEEISDNLKIFGQAVLKDATKTLGEFFRLSEDETSKEGRLFLYREDWQAILITNAIYTYEVPLTKKITFKDQDGHIRFEVESKEPEPEE